MLKIKEYINSRFDELTDKNVGNYRYILTKIVEEVKTMFKVQCKLEECDTCETLGYEETNFVIGYIDENNELQMERYVEVIEHENEFIEEDYDEFWDK